MSLIHAPRGFILVTDAADEQNVLVPVSKIARVDSLSPELQQLCKENNELKILPKTTITLDRRSVEGVGQQIYVIDDLSTIAILINKSKG
jgi:hypothetical protein